MRRKKESAVHGNTDGECGKKKTTTTATKKMVMIAMAMMKSKHSLP